MSLFKNFASSPLNFRLVLACFVAVSVSLPMAWISLAKVTLFISGLVYAIAGLANGGNQGPMLSQSWTAKLTLITVCAFGSSLIWTGVDNAFALKTLVKHAKLLDIVLLAYLIRSAPEARRVVGLFLAAQVIVLLLSYLMAMGVPLPWGSYNAENLGTRYIVFAESYIDQSLMFCVLASVIWHIEQPTPQRQWLARGVAIAALVNVFFLLPGRTGYIAGIAVISLMAIWAAPRKYLALAAVGTPLLVAAMLFFSSGQSHERLKLILTETHHYSEQVEVASSSGWRLNAWRRSIQAIEARPLSGYGVGSWAPAVKSFEGSNASAVFGSGNSSNPHQEFLLWGVELGVGGTLLLVGLLLCMAKDAMQFPLQARRSMHSVLAVVTIACLFNSALYDDLIGDYLCVAMGILLAYGLQQTATQHTTHTG